MCAVMGDELGRHRSFYPESYLSPLGYRQKRGSGEAHWSRELRAGVGERSVGSIRKKKSRNDLPKWLLSFSTDQAQQTGSPESWGSPLRPKYSPQINKKSLNSGFILSEGREARLSFSLETSFPSQLLPVVWWEPSIFQISRLQSPTSSLTLAF